jgi:hypothetical protein
VAMRMIGFVQRDCMETWLLAIFLWYGMAGSVVVVSF